MIQDGIFILGDQIEHWNSHLIDTTNTVNDKPVYYWKNQNNGVIPGSAGQVILANCTDIRIVDQELTEGSVGILLGFSSYNNIINNNISGNYIGIFLCHSNANNITNNNASFNDRDGIYLESSAYNDIIKNTALSNNEYGIYLTYSPENNLIENIVNSNTERGILLGYSNLNSILNNTVNLNNLYGIYLHSSNENAISNNTVIRNINYGIYFQGSSNNHIYHNNFSNNTNQAYDDSDDNNWDNGYPSGGNYWSDYTGIDEYSGPNQNEEGSDGLGDTPYTNIQGGAGARDNYPLVEDIYPPTIQLISPFNNSVIKKGTLINLSISDPNLNQVTYSKNNGPDQALIFPYEINTTGWPDDNYIIEIRATDTLNNENIEWYNFTIDSTPPSITLNSPDNNSYIIWNVEINLTISDDNLDQVSYIKDDENAKSLSYPYIIDTNFWDEGMHILEVIAEDLAGNIRKEYYTFTKDTTPPKITLDSPENNTIITGDLEVNFTITDENLDAVYYRINNNTYQALPFPYRIYIKGLQDGRYVIDIVAVDLATIGDIDQYVFIKDTLWPEITLNSPGNNTVLMEASTLDFDVSDANLDSVTYSVNQGSFQTLEEPYDIDTMDWDDDLYTIKIRADDAADHLSEKWFIFRIDTTPPSISSSSPSDGESDVDVDGKIIIEFSESMDCDSVESAISTDPFIDYTCNWTNDNKTLTINFIEPLEYDTPYLISISSNAQDMAGRELDDDYNFEFTTAAKPQEEEDFPILILMALLIAIVVAVVIVALVMAKKRRTPAEVEEAQVEPMETAQPIQFTCSNCNNLLRVNDTGVVQNVICPFCSTQLTVQPREAVPQPPVEQPQPQPQPQPQIQQQTIPIMCPNCSHKFSAVKTDDKMKVQCPSCGASGTLRLPR
jgi:parallel beta-helix repeat protein